MADNLPGGYNGRILRVNLSTGKTGEEAIDEMFCRKYLGGAGFVAYFLWKELAAGTDPLGPENKLVFATGPVTGVALSGTGRHCVGAKSPLTGTIGKSEAGEFWGAELKRAGYDALIIEGKAERPVYLWIDSGRTEIKEAGHLWGKGTKETQEKIREELGDRNVRVAMVGPAGENRVLYAAVMHGCYDAAGRGGLGAVMGAKNLKAVAVRGKQATRPADPERLKTHRQWLVENFKQMRGFHDFGTGGAMPAFEVSGNLPVRNFRDGLFPGVKQIDATTLKETFGVGMDACFGCTVRCKKKVSASAPYEVDPAFGGPEYETLAALGSDCGVDNLAAVCRGNQLCNDYGLDTISTGSVIAFAMECFEKGLLGDTGGIDLRFGNEGAMLKAIDLIARREGIGDRLAEGSARLAREIGHGAEDFAMQVKGLEAGMHEPRHQPAFGLGFMINPHGADHCCNMHDDMYSSPRQLNELRPLGILETPPKEELSPRKVALLHVIQQKRIITDSLVTCLFLPYSFTRLADITAAVTGWDTDVAEQMRVGSRIFTLMRLFNVREGFTDKDDELPRRFYQPKTDGALSSTALDPAAQDKAKRYYYTLMGWDPKTGIPLPEKVEELGIE
ncbi:MAG: aldehyde ferredoxin oxidoreductase family protein [Chloroflexota bacterium]